MKALIGDIGRYALHDGPGIRTTVFFKGCPFRCPWCHNPEFIAPEPQILFFPERCLGCGDCAQVCPRKAITPGVSGVVIHRRICAGCGQCADICPTKAVELAGRFYTVDELVEILLRDRLYYETSGGGVTLSGGEPTMQMDFIQALLQRLRREHIHTVLETNGCFPMDEFRDKCLDHLDLIFFDLKIADADRHLEIIGKENHRIWSNLGEIQKRRPNRIIPRIPIIPGYTATKSNIRKIAMRLNEMGIEQYSLLPYHPYGRSKAIHLGQNINVALPDKPMSTQELNRWHTYFNWAARAAQRDMAIPQDHVANKPINREVNHAN